MHVCLLFLFRCDQSGFGALIRDIEVTRKPLFAINEGVRRQRKQIRQIVSQASNSPLLSGCYRPLERASSGILLEITTHKRENLSKAREVGTCLREFLF